MKVEKVIYPDGSFYPKVTDWTYDRNDEPAVQNLVMNINSYNDLWYLNQIKDVCNHNQMKVRLSIPCLLDAQADRRFNNSESANLKLVCKFINSLGFESVRIFHPHNAEVVENMIDNCHIVHNGNYIAHVLNKIYPGFIPLNNDVKKEVEKNTILMSTDAGGYKALGKVADHLKWEGEIFSASKSRKWDGEKSILTQQIDREDFGGKDVLIIDDLCVYGGTFVGLANLLQGKNCGNLYLAVSHMTVATPSKQLENSFHTVFSTRSKGIEYDLNNLELLPSPL